MHQVQPAAQVEQEPCGEARVSSGIVCLSSFDLHVASLAECATGVMTYLLRAFSFRLWCGEFRHDACAFALSLPVFSRCSPRASFPHQAKADDVWCSDGKDSCAPLYRSRSSDILLLRCSRSSPALGNQQSYRSSCSTAFGRLTKVACHSVTAVQRGAREATWGDPRMYFCQEVL